MGVAFKTCKCCGRNFPDTIYFVSCFGCGEQWCSDDCADIDDCIDIEEGDALSCKYCRKEDFDDSALLETALKYVGLSREELIEIHKGYL